MMEKELIVKNKTGLHARPAATFVQTAAKYKAALKLSVNNKSYNAKSILAVLSAGITCGSSIKLTADGADEQDALAELEKLILENCGEINI